jgi:hypothetical protein
MAGGMHGGRGGGRPLWQRAAAAAAGAAGEGDQPAARSPAPAADGARPCWVLDREGSLLAWRRGDDGWQALVVAWWPAAAVRPRIEGASGQQGEGGADEQRERHGLDGGGRP